MRESHTATSAADYFSHLGSLVAAIDLAAVESLVERVFRAWSEDRLVLTFGNGGSAATASHYVTDFVKTAAVEGQRPLRAICLNDNTPMLTAIGNDFEYADAFQYPLAAYARSGDLAIAISGSGTSPNMVRACEWARDHAVGLVALTGFDGGVMSGLADLHLNVPSQNYGPIEDLHMSIGHVVTQGLQARVAAQAARG